MEVSIEQPTGAGVTMLDRRMLMHLFGSVSRRGASTTRGIVPDDERCGR